MQSIKPPTEHCYEMEKAKTFNQNAMILKVQRYSLRYTRVKYAEEKYTYNSGHTGSRSGVNKHDPMSQCCSSVGSAPLWHCLPSGLELNFSKHVLVILVCYRKMEYRLK